jgi:pimeloyl-ACP methyl ester carboxylesterase
MHGITSFARFGAGANQPQEPHFMTTGRHSIRWTLVRTATLVFALLAAGGLLIYLRYRNEIRSHEARIAHGSKIVETPCGTLEYGESGSGEPILSLHGAGGGYDQGLMIADLIGSGYRVIAPSRFGFLNTPVPPDASVAAQADAYLCLLDGLHVNAVHVVATSAGGPSALALALRHPQRVKSLTLVSALSTLRPVRADGAGPSTAMLSDFGYWAVTTFLPGVALDALGLPAASQTRMSVGELDRTRNVLRMMLPMARRELGNNTDIVEQNLPAIEAMPIDQITAPTLVVHARDDTLVPFAQGLYSAAHIPGAKLAAFDDGGHLIIVKDVVWEEIGQFIAEHSRSDNSRPASFR